jgi:hypothetical protein
MRIEIDDPSFIDGLLDYLRICQCELETVHENWVEANPPAATIDPTLAALQLDGFLRVWRARHPEVRLRVVPPVGAGRRH